MDDKRIEYLQFHHESVFKGSYDFKPVKAAVNYAMAGSYGVGMVAESSAKYNSSGKKPNVQLRLGETIVTCEKCGKEYAQFTERQKEGHRFPEDDKCPYCGNKRLESLEFEFLNRRLD